QLTDDLVLAASGEAEARGVAVGLRVFAEVIETGVAPPRAARRLRVDLVEITENRGHRCVEAVEIQPVEARGRFRSGTLVIGPQPADEVEHVSISPHPGRKTLEAGERFDGFFVVPGAAYVAVHSVGVGPVSLDRDRAEPSLRDQPFGDLRALPVELVRAV